MSDARLPTVVADLASLKTARAKSTAKYVHFDTDAKEALADFLFQGGDPHLDTVAAYGIKNRDTRCNKAVTRWVEANVINGGSTDVQNKAKAWLKHHRFQLSVFQRVYIKQQQRQRKFGQGSTNLLANNTPLPNPSTKTTVVNNNHHTSHHYSHMNILAITSPQHTQNAGLHTSENVASARPSLLPLSSSSSSSSSNFAPATVSSSRVLDGSPSVPEAIAAASSAAALPYQQHYNHSSTPNSMSPSPIAAAGAAAAAIVYQHSHDQPSSALAVPLPAAALTSLPPQLINTGSHPGQAANMTPTDNSRQPACIEAQVLRTVATERPTKKLKLSHRYTPYNAYNIFQSTDHGKKLLPQTQLSVYRQLPKETLDVYKEMARKKNDQRLKNMEKQATVSDEVSIFCLPFNILVVFCLLHACVMRGRSAIFSPSPYSYTICMYAEKLLNLRPHVSIHAYITQAKTVICCINNIGDELWKLREYEGVAFTFMVTTPENMGNISHASHKLETPKQVYDMGVLLLNTGICSHIFIT